MPRRAKKLNIKSRQNANGLSTRSDFTVYDYAHSSTGKNLNGTVPQCKTRSAVSSGRLQKAATNAWRTEVKQMQGQSVLDQPQLTVSTDSADDITGIDDDDGDPVADESLMQVKQQSGSQQRQSRKKVRQLGEAGVVYPVDVWFLIGSYVSPEDVCTFACICRYTHVVAHSARFWLGLYHRFCRGSKSLPTSLQSTNVEHRPHGLRTRVIRALFHVYRPLSEQVLSHSHSAGAASSRTSSDPQQLTGLRCILAWQKRSSKSNWKFYFKFRRGSGKLDCPLSVASSVGYSKSPRELLAPADVLYNAEERCVILVVSTPHFLPLPVVMGQVLLKASVTGSIFTQSLRLVFSSEYIQPNRSDVAGSVVAHFDPFVAVRILPWWHPNYPHKR